MAAVLLWHLTIFMTSLIIQGLAFSGNFGVVRPNDPYIYIGSSLTLTCNLTKYDEIYDSRYLMFSRKNDEVISSKFITIESTRSIVLRLPITSPDDSGLYMCKLNRSLDRPVLIGVQSVQVEYEPQPVTEISCRVYNWENMTCTWDLGVQFVHPNTMDIRLVWTASGEQYDCPHQTDTSCSWWANDGENSYLTDLVYFMGVSIENKINKKFYPEKLKVIKIDTSEIVEPAPVENIRVERNSTCISLSWSHQLPHRRKVFKVQFRQAIDHQWEIKNVGELESLTLCGLRPHTTYNFQVQCKPILFGGKIEGFWSRPSSVLVKTDEDIPLKAPELSPGSYLETPCQHYCKKLVLFWKPLRPEDANGNITYYIIEFRVHNSNSEWETTRVKGETQHTLVLMASEDYDIKISAATSKGVSQIASQIYVPVENEKPSAPEHVVEAYSTTRETTVLISWEPIRAAPSRSWKQLVSYTVYWCKGSKMEKLCEEPIHSIDIPLSNTSYTVHVDSYESYMFGVAVNALSSSGETISSGFQWNTCSYLKNTKPELPPGNIRTALYQPNSGVHIEWDRLSCENTRAYVKSYLVSLCPSNKGDNCSGKISTYDVNREKNSLTIYNLEDGGRYKLWINAQSDAGSGPSSDVLYTVVIDRRLTAGEIGGIVVGALFVLIIFLFGIILCSRRVFKTVKQRYFEPVPIEIPTTLPPLPPIPMPPPRPSPESDSSDGIYEKIVEGPPSPGSSSESTTGVHAPLINNKWKLSSLKNHIYNPRRSTSKHSSDSGRGSISHSADTLLMRLHPSHVMKYRRSKKSNKSESDSGVMMDGRGEVFVYKSSDQSGVEHLQNCDTNIYSFRRGEVNGKCSDANPYSCVDLLDSKSEHYVDKLSQINHENKAKGNGSTLSLPQGLCKLTSFMSQPLDCRAQSAGNELDFEHHRLSAMKEAREFESSDIYSEDGTLGSIDDLEPEACGSGIGESVDSDQSKVEKTSGMNSYIKFAGEDKMNSYDDNVTDDKCNHTKCGCDCHSKLDTKAVFVDNGYVTEAALVGHKEENCNCIYDENKVVNSLTKKDDVQAPFIPELGKNSLRPCSQVYNLPPHFFGSLSTVLVDPSRTTEL